MVMAAACQPVVHRAVVEHDLANHTKIQQQAERAEDGCPADARRGGGELLRGELVAESRHGGEQPLPGASDPMTRAEQALSEPSLLPRVAHRGDLSNSGPTPAGSALDADGGLGSLSIDGASRHNVPVTLWRARVVLRVVVLVVAAYIAWQARFALLPFALGGIAVYMLTPVVDRLASLVTVRSHRGDVLRRGVAVLVLYVVIGLMFFGLSFALVPVAADQTARFVDELPELITGARNELNDLLREYHSRVPLAAQERIGGYAEEWTDSFASGIAATVRGSITWLTGTLGLLIGFLAIPFWMFYVLRDRHFAAQNFLQAIPAPAQTDSSNVLLMVDRLIGRYIRGQIVLGVVVGVAVGLGLTLLGVELSLALALFAGVTELIPIIGPWLGAVPAVVIVAATEPELLPWVVLLYVAVQQLENNLLVPRVHGYALDLHPAMIILLLVVGGSVFGFIGLIVIVPLSAILRELFWYVDHRLTGATPEEALRRTGIGRRLLRAGESEPPDAGEPAAPQAAGPGVAPAEEPGS